MLKTMVSQTGPRVVRSNFARGQLYPGKGPKRAKEPNENFGASKCYLGPNFWHLAPKGSTWQPWLWCTALWTVHRQHRI